MSEHKMGLLLPLGIGAALLLLLSKKSKSAANTTTASNAPDTKQIVPEAAPEYKLPAATEQAADEDNDEPDDNDGEQAPGQSSAEADDDSDNGEASSTGDDYGSYSSSSGSAASYRTTNSGNNTPATATQVAPSGNLSPGNTYNANGGFRSQADQVRQQRLRNNSMFIRNGKPGIKASMPLRTTPAVAARRTQTATPSLKQGAIFPLKYGQRNAYIKEVQKKVGVTPTGYFGIQTRTALQRKFGAATISEVLYKQIMTGKTPVAVKQSTTAVPVRSALHPVAKHKPGVHKKYTKQVLKKGKHGIVKHG
jgi:hypothetical protein